MRHDKHSEILTPAEKLRAAIGEAEIIVANLHGAGAGKVRRLLELLDEIAEEHSSLRETGIDLRPEEARIAGIHDKLRARKAVALRELRRGGESLSAWRDACQPAGDRWWWWLDEDHAAERRRRLRRAGVLTLAIALVLAIAYGVYQRFFAPDPIVAKTYANLTRAQSAIMAGQYDEAIALLEENMALQPSDADWPTRLGVLQEQIGNRSVADLLYQKGLQLYEDPSQFYLTRAQAFREVGKENRAAEDALKVTELNPSLPMGYFVLGQSLAGLGRLDEARRAYEKVIELTEGIKGEETLYVLTKVELAFLAQRALSAPPNP